MDKYKIIGIVAVIVLFILLGSCFGGKSEYEEAGETFGQWVNSDPNDWTDTQKDYFNDFMEWSDKN